MRWSVLLWSLVLVSPLGALVPGAWERFSTEANADAWTVFGYYFDDEVDHRWKSDFFYPGWSDGEDPFIGFTMEWDSTYIFADAAVAAGAFTGDYAAADVEWITMDVAVSDTSLVAFFDVSILSDVDGVERYYYTDSYTVEAFQDNAWEPVAFSLEDTWYYWDPTIEEGGQVVGGWVEVTLSDAVLSNVTEIGITFIHADESGAGVDVMIDNVALSHPLVTPELAAAAASGRATFSFQPLPAHVYDLERFDPSGRNWAPVTGQTDILGPDPFRFRPPGAGAGLYRVTATPHYTEIVSVPSG